MLSKGYDEKSVIKKLGKSGLYGAVYLLSDSMRQQRFKYFVALPDSSIAMLLWRAADKKIINSLYNSKTPKVKENTEVYLPKVIKNFSQVLVAQLKQDNIPSSSVDLSAFRSQNVDPDENAFSGDVAFEEHSPNTISSLDFHTDEKSFDTSSHVKVRILFNNKFPYNFRKNRLRKRYHKGQGGNPGKGIKGFLQS